MTVETRVTRLEGRVTHLEADRDSHGEKLDQLLRIVVDLHNDQRRFEAQLPELIARAVVDAQQDLRNDMRDVRNDVRDLRRDLNERFEQVDKRFEQVDKRFEQVDEQIKQVKADVRTLHDRRS